MPQLVINKLKIRLIFLAISTVFLVGCAGTPKHQRKLSVLTLSDELIVANKGNVGGLYDAWIKPFKTNENMYIPHSSMDELTASEAAVRNGFDRFCSVSGGAVINKKGQYGDNYRCITSSGDFVGEFSTSRIKGYFLLVNFDSPGLVAGRNEKLAIYEALKMKNGPTGWIETDAGKFKFIRFGTLKERHVVVIGQGQDSKEPIPIEEVVRVDLQKKCCDINLLLKDGSKKTLNQASFAYSKPYGTHFYGGGIYGVPIVILDPESGQPYTRIFSYIRDIRSIQIDGDEGSWKNKPADVIKTTLDINSQSRMDSYMHKLKEEANQLYAEAIKSGAIKLLVDGKLTQNLTDHLQFELRRISREPDCRGDVVNGITSLEAPLRCRVATKELDLVVWGRYSLVTDITPLSTIIVLEKIKSDIR